MNTRIALIVIAAFFVTIVGCKKEDEKTLAQKVEGNYFVKDTAILQNPPCFSATDNYSEYGISIKATGENTVEISGFPGCTGDAYPGTVTETSFVATSAICDMGSLVGTINGDKITFTFTYGVACQYNSKAVATKQQ